MSSAYSGVKDSGLGGITRASLWQHHSSVNIRAFIMGAQVKYESLQFHSVACHDILCRLVSYTRREECPAPEYWEFEHNEYQNTNGTTDEKTIIPE